MTSAPQAPANRLINEKSPYLLQHAHNPVDWYPWGPEAFETARRTGRPIFLSIGYSTCHWCHVMAHESFESPDIAAIMNQRYVNIKLDREERPDVDALYMTAVQALTGGGGWPMSVWLTPDLKPFFGGTYFPPEDRYGRPGFPTVLMQLAEIYEKERDRVTEVSKQIEEVLERSTRSSASGGRLPAPGSASTTALRMLETGFDSQLGGFSPAPKFPMPVYLDFLLHAHAGGAPRALEMAAFTLRKMAEGGLYDQLGGGFARYSTDERWLVPHFEKMLYDNAQLLRTCARAAAATQDPLFRRVALETAAYLRRDLAHPGGAFYSAEDADSEGKEGTFYLWTFADLKRVLGDEAEFAAGVYGATVAGNFMDPHTREAGKNVLSLAAPTTDAARLESVRRRLFDERARRPRPHRDEKILTEWNGLAISGLAKAGFWLNEPDLVAAAARAAEFLHASVYDAGERQLFRRWKDGDRAIPAQQGDYAMLIEGLLDLFEAGGDPRWLSWAAALQERQDELFWDKVDGGYFMSVPAGDLILRMKDDADNVIPSGNSVAALNGLRLAALTGREAFRKAAVAALTAFAGTLAERPLSVARMIEALDREQKGDLQVIVAGPDRAAVEPFLESVRRAGGADVSTVILTGSTRGEAGRLMPHLSAIPTDRAAAFLCRQFACQPPIHDAARLEKQLSAPR